jgi:hypothetical protein
MDSVPDSPPTASTIKIPFWQRNLGAIMVERFITAELLVSTACQIIDSSAYGNSPAPP